MISPMREHAHGDDDEADAVGELGDAEGEALHAGIDVGADDAEQQAQRPPWRAP